VGKIVVSDTPSSEVADATTLRLVDTRLPKNGAVILTYRPAKTVGD
jgi:hypothetical protein